jgi:hypothetical protein
VPPPPAQRGVTLLLGAGFSQALGLPGTGRITQLIDDALQTGPNRATYVALRDRLRARFATDYNFETLMAALEECMTFRQAGMFGIGGPYKTVVPDIATLHPGLTPDLATAMYEIAMNILVTEVSADWLSGLPKVTEQALQSFFDGLQVDGPLSVATLNYDLGAEHFITAGIDGFAGTGSPQSFDSIVFFSDDTRARIAHVHGSIQYGIPEVTKAFVKTPGPRAHLARWTELEDGTLYTAMITGTHKEHKIALLPYAAYYSWLAQAVLRSSRLVVVGYGVGDLHITSWLTTAARHHVGPDFRMVIIDRFSGQPPDRILELFAYAAGFEDGIELEPALNPLPFHDDVAQFGAALLIRSGLPLTRQQQDCVAAFLH